MFDNTIKLIDYINSNLPKNIPYKIVDSIDNLNNIKLMNLLGTQDGFSNNSNF
jgi:hypothetical protein